MAANYTREIVFKVNDRAIKQATDRLVQSLGKIEKKLDVIAAGFSKVEKSVSKVDKNTKQVSGQLNKWEKGFVRFTKPLVKAVKDVGTFRHNFELTEKAIAAIARGGGLAHLRNLLGESVKAQDALLISNSGYIQSLQATRQLQGEINQELIGRQRILDGLNRSEGLTAGAGLAGLRSLRGEQKGILDRMLATNEGKDYLEQAKRVKQVENLINEELKARDKIMKSLLTKQERLAKLGTRIKDVAGKGAQFARPGRGIERRGMGLAGLGLAGVGVHSGHMAAGITPNVMTPLASGVGGLAKAMGLGAIKGASFLGVLNAIGAAAMAQPQLIGIYATALMIWGNKVNKIAIGPVKLLHKGLWGLGKLIAETHRPVDKLKASLKSFSRESLEPLKMEFKLSANAAKQFEDAAKRVALSVDGVAKARARLRQTRIEAGHMKGSGFGAWSAMMDRREEGKRAFAERQVERASAKRELQRTRGLSIEQRINEVLKRRGKIMIANGQIQDIQNKKGIFKGGAGGAISSAMIGGGFPLLFGQGGASAIGGGIGGLLGGAIGGGFGFGLSIVGTALGQAYQRNLDFNKSLAVLNVRLKDTGDGSVITAKEIDALAKKMNITKQEAMGLVSAFSQFDSKGVRMSLTNMFGEEAQSYTAISEGARTQAALAELIFASRAKIGNAKAEELLQQNLINESATVELALAKAMALEEHKKTVERERQITWMDRLLAVAASDSATGRFVDPIVFAEERVKKLQLEFEKNKAKDADNFLKSLEEVRRLLGLVKKGVEITDSVQALNALFAQIGDTIKNGMVDAIEGAIEGTKTLGEVAGSVFRGIARMLLQYGVTTGLGSLSNSESWQKFFGTRAGGGPVTRGRPYVVGEKGPELFVPKTSGGIVPNHQLGGANVVVNVDASGSEVQGNAGEAEQLGRLIGAAVQAELIKQKRNGGILAR